MAGKTPEPWDGYPAVAAKFNAVLMASEAHLNTATTALSLVTVQMSEQAKAAATACAELRPLILGKLADAAATFESQRDVLLATRDAALAAAGDDEPAKTTAQRAYDAALSLLKDDLVAAQSAFEQSEKLIDAKLVEVKKFEDCVFELAATVLNLIDGKPAPEDQPAALANARLPRPPDGYRQAFARKVIAGLEGQIKRTTEPGKLAQLRSELRDAQARLANIQK
jgi:hypothetical protein